ncbi:hypothetical protein BDW66DRAFT_131076 [Aspergillus desertorum]
MNRLHTTTDKYRPWIDSLLTFFILLLFFLCALFPLQPFFYYNYYYYYYSAGIAFLSRLRGKGQKGSPASQPASRQPWPSCTSKDLLATWLHG